MTAKGTVGAPTCYVACRNIIYIRARHRSFECLAKLFSVKKAFFFIVSVEMYPFVIERKS
jgi:hypothetical protein